jgi:hypothetical protein
VHQEVASRRGERRQSVPPDFLLDPTPVFIGDLPGLKTDRPEAVVSLSRLSIAVLIPKNVHAGPCRPGRDLIEPDRRAVGLEEGLRQIDRPIQD